MSSVLTMTFVCKHVVRALLTTELQYLINLCTAKHDSIRFEFVLLTKPEIKAILPVFEAHTDLEYLTDSLHHDIHFAKL